MSPRFRAGVAARPEARPVLVLANLGTPAAPTAGAVRRYLAQFLHDWRVVELTRWLWCPILHFIILPIRSGKVAKKYAGIWTPNGSPLLALSLDLAAEVQRQLPEFEVKLGMRYGEPSLPGELRAAHDAGATRVLVLPLYPQYAASTVASVHDAVFDELRRWRVTPELRLLRDYHVDAGWLDALADSVRAHWAANGRGERLVMSFHGLPKRHIDAGDPYRAQCEAGARALAQRLGLRDDEWVLTFQSRFGREEWLQPYTDATLRGLAQAGVKRVDLVCPGFAVDCLETLEENAIENAAIFREAGGEAVSYISCLNAAPAHAAALAAIAQRAAADWLA
jgi:ferrochelatase